MHEAGVTGYEANAWQAIVAPAGTPAAIVAKLNRRSTTSSTSAETQEHFTRLGWSPKAARREGLGDYIKSEIVRWARCCRRPARPASRELESTGDEADEQDVTIGLVVPFADDKVPDEGLQMYPDMHFIPRGVGVRSLTPEGYAAAFDAIRPAAEQLAAKDVDAIMVIGTSLTFYRGPEAHDRLLEKLRARTGLPVSTMSQAIVDGLREVGANASR